MESPTLLVLDSKRILVSWIAPATPNGVIIRYEVIYSLTATPTNITTISPITANSREITVSGS